MKSYQQNVNKLLCVMSSDVSVANQFWKF